MLVSMMRVVVTRLIIGLWLAFAGAESALAQEVLYVLSPELNACRTAETLASVGEFSAVPSNLQSDCRTLKRGDQVQRLGKEPRGLARITLSDGFSGYASDSFLASSPPSVIRVPSPPPSPPPGFSVYQPPKSNYPERSSRDDDIWPGLILLTVFLFIGGIVYFIPAIVARNRGHADFNSILWLNILAGWTFIGWFGALIWALDIIVIAPAPAGMSLNYLPTEATKTCPRCAETIKAAAKVCRYCGHEFESPGSQHAAAESGQGA